MRPDAEQFFASPRGIFVSLIGLLLAPLMFLTNEIVTYIFVDWSCRSAGLLPIHLMNLGCLIVAALGGVVALRNWKAVGYEWPSQMGGVIGRTRLLATLGTFSSFYFAIAVIAQGIPPMLISPCRT